MTKSQVILYVVGQRYAPSHSEPVILVEADTDRDTAVERFTENHGGPHRVYALNLDGLMFPDDGEEANDPQVTVQVPDHAEGETVTATTTTIA
jgi:hypothetical protein